MINPKEKQNCCGCGLCSTVCKYGAITMEYDEFGFRYPKINESLCVGCDACEYVCIIHNPQTSEPETTSFLVAHKDINIQMNSASGGAFSAICQAIT